MGRASRTPPVWLDDQLRRRLLRYAQHLVGDAADAEDLAQETLLRVSQGVGRLRSRERVEGWMFRICRHVAIDHLRHRRVRRHLWASLPVELGELPGEPPREAPDLSPTDLSGLPAAQRVLVALHHVRGVPQPVLCRMAGLSPSALRVRLFRARRQLRRRRQALEDPDLAARGR